MHNVHIFLLVNPALYACERRSCCSRLSDWLRTGSIQFDKSGRKRQWRRYANGKTSEQNASIDNVNYRTNTFKNPKGICCLFCEVGGGPCSDPVMVVRCCDPVMKGDCVIYTTIAAVCKWVFTNMSFSSRAGAFRQRSSQKSQVILAFVLSWIGDFFVFVGLIFCKLRRVCIFWVEIACGYAQTADVENKHCGCGSVHYITIGDRRLRTVAEATWLWDAESIIFNRGRSSRRGLSRVGYFITLNGPLTGTRLVTP